jgi:hypothetical protein
MKNTQGYLIISISIIISTLIIVGFFPDPNASVNDCYKKVYKSALASAKDDFSKSEAAVHAKEMCLDK